MDSLAPSMPPLVLVAYGVSFALSAVALVVWAYAEWKDRLIDDEDWQMP